MSDVRLSDYFQTMEYEDATRIFKAFARAFELVMSPDPALARMNKLECIVKNLDIDSLTLSSHIKKSLSVADFVTVGDLLERSEDPEKEDPVSYDWSWLKGISVVSSERILAALVEIGII